MRRGGPSACFHLGSGRAAGPQTFSQLRGEMTGTFQARGLVWLVQSLVNMLNDAARLRAALTWQGSCGHSMTQRKIPNAAAF
jgi:hypothetical protein